MNEWKEKNCLNCDLFDFRITMINKENNQRNQ